MTRERSSCGPMKGSKKGGKKNGKYGKGGKSK